MHKCLNISCVPAARPSVLSAAEVRVLERLMAGADALAAGRAGIVLAEHRRRRGDEDVEAGATRQTAATWYRRFAAEGADGLRDRPRAGRPRVHGQDSSRAVLLAPLYSPTVRWTSHSLAAMTGQSQSSVVRVWRQAFEASDPHPLPAGGLALAAVRLDRRGSLLVLAESGAALPEREGGSFMRSPRRPPLQTLLAADLLAAPSPATSGRGPGDPDAVQALLEAARRMVGPGVPLVVLARGPAADVGRAAGVDVHQVAAPAAWQGLLRSLVPRCTDSPPGELVALQQRVMAWARSGTGDAFEWVGGRVGAGPAHRPAGRDPAPRPTGQVVADAVLSVVMARIAAGRLAAGDRVTESSLSRAVHASRGHVREALLTLASNGLLELEPRRSARVPAPQVADVVETYALRRALGALVVRRAVHWTPGALDDVVEAHAALLAAAGTGDAWATGEADLRFQDALALSTGMRRIQQIFLAVSSQIRLFTAVMGVRYTYSIPAMVADDTSLLEHLRARDEGQALKAWHAKMDDALGYMVNQLGSPGAR